jgi:tRNA dimethylallyltransferase
VSAVERALRLAQETADPLAIVGPTASGKTSLAMALAERLGGEIVSADRVQVYRGFDVGSGKPSGDERARVPHHLIDAIDPLEPMDAARWAALALASIADIRGRGRVPILCGGTFLWMKALLFGLAPAPAGDPVVRERHRVLAEEQGRAALHARLQAVDAECAARIHPNDLLRVSRALEVYELSGKSQSAWQREHGFARERQRARLVAIALDSTTLTGRIRARVSEWLARGWIDEVEGLLGRGCGSARAMGSVGYAQVRAMIEGRLARDQLHEAIVCATRVYARRQRTWLARAEITWL